MLLRNETITVLYSRVECGRLFLRGQNRSTNQRSGMILEVLNTCWKANQKTNLMILNKIKIGRLQPEKLRNMFERIQSMKKS